MSQLNITCPRCGFSKNIEQDQIPSDTQNIKCPKCQQTFALMPEEETTFEPIAAAATLPSGIETSAPGAAQAHRTNGLGGSEATPDGKFCSTCGQRIHLKAEICPKCGVRVAPPANAISKVALLLITFFFGWVGGHKFYQKKYLLGILYLLFCWTFIPRIVSFIEFIIYACKSESELQETYPETSSAALIAVFLAFFGIMIIGILAAIAIPQFAAYRQKAYDAVAQSDLKNCRTQVESFYFDNKVYPTATGQIECSAAPNVALYYLTLGPDEYQLISFHKNGPKAFLEGSSDTEISENTREEIEKQLEEKYGAAALEPAFHFME